jgi:hypothetical protein
MYVTPTAFARWSRTREIEADRFVRAGMPWRTPPAMRAINVPDDPPEPRLPDDWPKPPHLPEEPSIDPRKPPKHDPDDPKEPPQEDPPDPKEPPRHDPPPSEPPQIEPEFPGKDPPIHDPLQEPHDPSPRIDARA